MSRRYAGAGRLRRDVAFVNSAYVLSSDTLLRFTDGVFARGSEASAEFLPGVVTWFGSNVPRVAPDGTWLLEGGSRNLIVAPEDLSDAAWDVVSGTTPTAGSVLAPDGDADADQVSYNAFNRTFGQSITEELTDSTTYAFSGFIKRLNDVDTNLLLFRLIGKDAAATSFNTVPGTTWARFSGTEDVGAGVTVPRLELRTNIDLAATPPLLINYWGAQVEALPFATSYIRYDPVLNPTSTRAPDSLRFDAAQIPAQMLSGRWEFDVYPNRDASSGNLASTYQYLFNFPGLGVSDGIVFFEHPGRARVVINGLVVVNLSGIPAVTNQKMTFRLDMAAGLFVLETGSTELTASFTPASFVAGSGVYPGMQVGNRYDGNFPVAARISEPRAWQERIELLPHILDFNDGTFSRGSEASSEFTPGVVTWHASNAPRVAPDGSYLFEGGSTNLLPNPNDIEAWALKSSVVAVSNARTAPDGSQTAGLVDFQSDASAAQLRDNVAMDESVVHTGSLWVRGDTAARLTGRYRLVMRDGTDAEYEPVTPGSYEMPQTWQRIAATGNSGVGAWQPLHLLSQGASPSTEGYVVWGNQVEALPFATSFIDTGGIHIPGGVRAPDVLTFETSQIPGQLLSGSFEFDFWPMYDSSSDDAGIPDRFLYSFRSDEVSTGGIWINTTGGISRLYLRTPGVTKIQPIEFSAGQKMTVRVDLPNGTATLSGATAGDTTLTEIGNGWGTLQGLRIGAQRGALSALPFYGRISPPRFF